MQRRWRSVEDRRAVARLLLHRRRQQFCFSPGWNVNESQQRREDVMAEVEKGAHPSSEGNAAVASSSPTRGDFFPGSEVGSITGSNEGVTLFPSEGDADIPTILSVDR